MTSTKSGNVPTIEAVENSNNKRRRRFRREPEFKSDKTRAGRIELRRRDLDIITSVASHRFMNTKQVCRVFACDCPRVQKVGTRNGKPANIFVKNHYQECSCTCHVQDGKQEHAESCPALFKDDQHVASRLRELYQAGYLERPIAQLQLRVKNGVVGEGSVPIVYSVTSSGLELIGPERRFSLGNGKLSWVNKVNEGTRVFLEHTLAIADVAIGVDHAVRKRPHLERLSEAALSAGMPPERKNSPRPWSLRVRYKGESLTALCDLAFAIGDRQARKRWNFLVEVDLGNMPIERKDLNRTSILRKLIAYAKAYDDGEHANAFAWKGFRTIILTTSQERVQSCVEAARDRFGNASVGRIFLFGTLEAANDILGYEFTDVDGRRTRLID
jgi:hypothetical protein